MDPHKPSEAPYGEFQCIERLRIGLTKQQGTSGNSEGLNKAMLEVEKDFLKLLCYKAEAVSHVTVAYHIPWQIIISIPEHYFDIPG